MISEQKQRVLLIGTLVITDALAVTAGLLLAYYLRIGSGLLPYTSPYASAAYLGITVIAVPVWLLIFLANRLYHFDSLLGGPDEYASVFRGCTYGTVALVILSFFERGEDLSRGWLLLSWLTCILVVGGERFLMRRVAFLLRRWGWFTSRAVIVGANEQAKAIAQQLQPPASSGIAVVGFLDDFLPPGTPVLGDLQVLGSPRTLSALIPAQRISEVIVVPNATAWESFQEILLANGQVYQGARLRISPGFYELLTTGVRVDHKAFVPLLTPEKGRLTGLDALFKMLLDFVLALGGAVLWLPALGLFALLKRIAAPGAVFRRQQVLGRGGRTFAALTFDVPENGAVPRKRPASFGERLDRLLQRSGLYRLPQFIHVLAGQMSLVGPRPVPANPGPAYPEWLPNLLTVKPGITGPWIMAGSAGESPEEERRLDTYYVRNWTIWLDLQILFRSVGVVLGGKR
jgi:lipopolysaccharide/colanic/teichoic acid biosynthesis glycosyltransferase